MKFRSIGISLVVLALTFAVTFAKAENCNPSSSQIEVTKCFGNDLYDADVKLNLSYQSLMNSLDPIGGARLKKEQISWLKERNQICDLTVTDTQSENWHQTLVQNHKKALCVTRYSKVRTTELENFAQSQKAKSVTLAHSQQDYQITAKELRESGLYYFEVKVAQREISRLGSVVIWVGCGESKSNTGMGVTLRIRPGANTGDKLIGVALDLDQGKFYHSQDGSWDGSEPGSSKGIEVKLGRPYTCGIDSTELVKPLVEKRMLDVNFGERPFIFLPPESYVPYRGKPNWMPIGEPNNGKHVFLDYTSFQLSSDPPTFTSLQEYPTLHESPGTGVQYKGMQSQMKVDCNNSRVENVTPIFVSAQRTYVAQSGFPMKVEQQSDDNLGARLIKTLCFLNLHKFDLPDISSGGNWETMASPIPSVRIFEAVDRRQSKGDYLLVINKNQIETDVVVNGESSNLVVSVSALSCKDLTLKQIMGIRYGNSGQVIGADFYFDENRFPQLLSNRKRLIDACAAQSSAAVGN